MWIKNTCTGDFDIPVGCEIISIEKNIIHIRDDDGKVSEKKKLNINSLCTYILFIKLIIDSLITYILCLLSDDKSKNDYK